MIVKNLHAPLLPAFPLLLLLLALSTVFPFGNERGHFYRPGHHDHLTKIHLVLAANRSPAHNFLGFFRHTLDADGAPTYDVYNRFPIGGYLLIKLAILPFDDDLSAQLYAARLLMLLCFTATAVLAYLSLARLTTHRWLALTATLLAFSSPYCLYYNDMVATEVGPDLFGVFLVFHGMVLFVQEGRFRQLLGKTCLALLLGWHVYALLLPFVVLGLAGTLVQAVRGLGRVGGVGEVSVFWGHLIRVTASLLRSRYVALGVVALLFGTAVLSVNFANEYVALNGDTDLTDLPSVRSMLKRTGLDDRLRIKHPGKMAWPAVLKSQGYRIAGMALPYAFAGRVPQSGELGNEPGLLGWQDVSGVLVAGTCLLGLAFVRPTLLWATLVLSGFCWALPMRHVTATHDFESLSYIGLPLVFFSLVLLVIRRLSGRRLSVAVSLAVAALLVFVLSGFQMAGVGYTAERAEKQKDEMTDLKAIRKMTVGKVVVISNLSNPHYDKRYDLTTYALTGTLLAFEPETTKFADFVISRFRYHDAALLTPDNRRVFLYRRDGYERHIDQIIKETGAPLIHAEYRGHVTDVYRSDNRLYYVRRPRPKPTGDARFFLHVIPADVSDLPDHRKRWHFDNLDFSFYAHRIPHSTRAIAVRILPDYAVARIRTGQFTSEGRLWDAEVGFEEQPDDD